MLPFAGGLAPPEGGHDSGGGVGGGVQLGLRRAHADRRSVGVSAHVSHAAHRPRHKVGRGVMGVGAGLPEGGDGGIDERGVFAGEALIAESERVHAPRRERFDEDVGVPRERSEGVRAFGVGEVKLDSALVGAVRRPEQALARAVPPADERASPPRPTAAGRLHFDHVRAEVGEQFAAPVEAALREVEDGVWG